jgi:hypothetical protein
LSEFSHLILLGFPESLVLLVASTLVGAKSLVDSVLVHRVGRISSASNASSLIVDGSAESGEGTDDEKSTSENKGQEDEENGEPWLLELGSGASKESGDEGDNTESQNKLTSSGSINVEGTELGGLGNNAHLHSAEGGGNDTEDTDEQGEHDNQLGAHGFTTVRVAGHIQILIY